MLHYFAVVSDQTPLSNPGHGWLNGVCLMLVVLSSKFVKRKSFFSEQ